MSGAVLVTWSNRPEQNAKPFAVWRISYHEHPSEDRVAHGLCASSWVTEVLYTYVLACSVHNVGLVCLIHTGLLEITHHQVMLAMAYDISERPPID